MSDKDDCEKISIYVTNDFLPQFVDGNSFVPLVVNLNSAQHGCGIVFDPGTDTLTIKKSRLFQCQFTIQLSNVAFPPPSNPNPLVRFEVRRNGGTLVSSQTNFNANSLDTIYVTSTLFTEYFRFGDKIQLIFAQPAPIPSGSVLRIDFASVTLIEIS
ncbi:hypothetical protein [Paenibacillus qinlingensis]|uniref:Uncharacterized protein n=1 Tax=Paenibacillus qinlingensis TaxID=1837343 RepID=A0ABU1P4M4_9BACL|nr:hypothetical protein [Paenibacillus qinlingensis]MDR6554697.1 hypothetical protein [Paenibacillus qinlingensis]